MTVFLNIFCMTKTVIFLYVKIERRACFFLFLKILWLNIYNKADDCDALFILLLVMLYMLFVLTHHRLGDTARSQSLQELHTLMLYDDGTHVTEECRDISWQTLGICQQTFGDYQPLRANFNNILITNVFRKQKCLEYRQYVNASCKISSQFSYQQTFSVDFMERNNV